MNCSLDSLEFYQSQKGLVIRMQVNGVGNSHDSYSHQVTECNHDHAEGMKNTQGGAGAKGSSQVSPSQVQEQVQNTGFSLSAWMNNLLGKGKSILRGIWGNSNAAGDLTVGENTENPVPDDPFENAAMNQAPGITVHSNTYYQPIEQSRAPFVSVPVPGQDVPVSPFQKIRIRVQQVTKQLADHLPGHFFGSSGGKSLQTKQDRSRQDLRKRSQYKEDDVEIECILTDESYLMDSYNRKGEYSRLSTRNKKY